MLPDRLPTQAIFDALLGTTRDMQLGCMFTVDYLNGTFTRASGAVERTLGITPEALAQKGLGYLVDNTHPDDRPRMEQMLMTVVMEAAQAYLKGEPQYGPYRVNYRLRHPEGDYRLIESVTYFLSFHENGYVHEGMAILFDITEERAQELEFLDLLRNQQAYLVRIMDELLQKHIAEYRRLQGPNAPHLLPWTLQKDPVHTLTPREQEVLKCLAQGKSTKEVAQALGITENTVESHRKHLLDKFGVRNTAQLILVASKHYWLH